MRFIRGLLFVVDHSGEPTHDFPKFSKKKDIKLKEIGSTRRTEGAHGLPSKSAKGLFNVRMSIDVQI